MTWRRSGGDVVALAVVARYRARRSRRGTGAQRKSSLVSAMVRPGRWSTFVVGSGVQAGRRLTVGPGLGLGLWGTVVEDVAAVVAAQVGLEGTGMDEGTQNGSSRKTTC